MGEGILITVFIIMLFMSFVSKSASGGLIGFGLVMLILAYFAWREGALPVMVVSLGLGVMAVVCAFILSINFSSTTVDRLDADGTHFHASQTIFGRQEDRASAGARMLLEGGRKQLPPGES